MRPEYCPHCGAEVPEKATACPECGSSDETGWSEEASADRLGLPSEDFDYNRYLKEEFGPAENKPAFKKTVMVVMAIILVALIILGICY